MKIANLIATILVLVGALVWGLIGIFDWNLVGAIFGASANVGSRIIYCLVFAASLWLIGVFIARRGHLDINPTNNDKTQN